MAKKIGGFVKNFLVFVTVVTRKLAWLSLANFPHRVRHWLVQDKAHGTNIPSCTAQSTPEYPNYAWSYYDRAIVHALKGDHKESVRDYTEAIRLNPNVPDFYYNRACSHHAIGSLDKAMVDFNEAIRRAPKEFSNYCGRASLFEDMGQFDKASADYDQVIRLNPRDASDYRFRGSAHFAKGNYRAAALDLEKATRLSPADYDSLCFLAWFQATCPEDSLRNGKDALEKSLHACELSRWESADVVDTLAAAYAEVGDFDTAVKYEAQAINMKGVYAFKRKKMQERLELYRQHKPYRKESSSKHGDSCAVSFKKYVHARIIAVLI